jgi:hypothetical protein
MTTDENTELMECYNAEQGENAMVEAFSFAAMAVSVCFN